MTPNQQNFNQIEDMMVKKSRYFCCFLHLFKNCILASMIPKLFKVRGERLADSRTNLEMLSSL